MASPRWGNKHTCLECGAAFYDMQRSPMACPKCGARHQPVALLKSDGRAARKSRGLRPVPVAAPVEVLPAVSDKDETETTEDDGDVLEIDEEAPADEDDGAAETDDRDR